MTEVPLQQFRVEGLKGRCKATWIRTSRLSIKNSLSGRDRLADILAGHVRGIVRPDRRRGGLVEG